MLLEWAWRTRTSGKVICPDSRVLAEPKPDASLSHWPPYRPSKVGDALDDVAALELLAATRDV